MQEYCLNNLLIIPSQLLQVALINSYMKLLYNNDLNIFIQDDLVVRHYVSITHFACKYAYV